MLNKTDFKILEFCSRHYRFFSASETSRGVNLHVTTVSGRLDALYKKDYLKRKEMGKGFNYRFNFKAENARKFRLSIDMDFVFGLNLEKVINFIHTNRNNMNIISCILYGSSLETKEFNDIDLLVIYEKEKIDARGFDVFQMDTKTFRNLYSLGEPRLQAALAAGRILIDREFIFNYFENDLPIKPSEDILYELGKKAEKIIKTIEKSDMEKEILREKMLEVLDLHTIIEFISKGQVVPSKATIQGELEKINPKLAGLIKKIKHAKKKKDIWDMFYSEVLK